MGLFGKLKDNMNHGGVKVHVQAPGSVPGNQVIPVIVTITADSSQTINSVKAEIKAEAKEQGITMGGNNNMNGGMGVRSSRTMSQTIAEVENRESFTIGPGETKTVNLELYISGDTGNGNPMGQLANIGGGMGSALQAVAAVAQKFEHVNYLYTVHASADVPGVSLDPSDKQSIQILPPTAAVQAPPQAAQPAADMLAQNQPQPAQPILPIPGMPAPVRPPQDPGSVPPQIQ